MSGKLLTICHCEPSAAQLRGYEAIPKQFACVLRLLRGARNDKYLTGHDIIARRTLQSQGLCDCNVRLAMTDTDRK